MRAIAVLVTLCAAVCLSGCAAVTVVDTAVSVTSTVVKTAVDVTAGAVEAVAGPSSKSDDKPDCDDRDKDKDVCKKAKDEKPAS
jgi:hypothetical protein